jgi:membrane peptidoglycan carboxypeptidase
MNATGIVRGRRRRRDWDNRPAARLLRILVIGLLTLVFVAALSLTVAVTAGSAGSLAFMRGLPDISKLQDLPQRYTSTSATTRLYARGEQDDSGEGSWVLIDEIGDPRQGSAGWLSFADIPPVVVQATLAAEDASFLSEPPLDPTADLSAWWSTGAFEQPVSPYVRELIERELKDNRSDIDPNTRDGLRDLHDLWGDRVLAWQVEDRYGRERILEWVLNSRYYGHLAYGIEAAARVYFGKPAADLNLGEAAMLAAVGLDPAANPFDDPAAARRGQQAVLEGLVAAGIISNAEAAATDFPTIAAAPGSTSTAPHFARLARAELEQVLGPRRLLQGGLAVETTLDLALQQQAACVLATAPAPDTVTANPGGGPPCPAARLLPPASGDTAAILSPAGGVVVVLDPTIGTIEALWSSSPETSLSLPARPTGSLVRPFIYLTALSQGQSAASLLMDVETSFPDGGQPYTPNNANDEFHGPLRLRQAAAGNLAVPAVQALSWVGVPRVLDNARALGIRLDEDRTTTGPAFAEEGFAATLLDLAQAFGVVNNGGTSAGHEQVQDGAIRPATIARITAMGGEDLYRFSPAMREILAPDLDYLLTDILADEAARCEVVSCLEPPGLSGGRRAVLTTGESTTTGDTWAIGYTPEQVIGVWRGSATGESADSRDTTAIWRALAEWSLEGTPPGDWPRPAGLVAVDVCAVSGMLPRRGVGCPTVTEWFVPGTEPVVVDTMVREVAVNRETGRLATIFTPPDLIERQTFIVYPLEAAEWAAEAGLPVPPDEYDTISDVPTRRGDAAELRLEPWSEVNGRVVLNGTAGGEDFAYFRLAHFSGLLPEAIQLIGEPVETPVTNGELGIWDTTQLADGLYTVLLTVVKHDGRFDELAVPVTVEN